MDPGLVEDIQSERLGVTSITMEILISSQVTSLTRTVEVISPNPFG